MKVRAKPVSILVFFALLACPALRGQAMGEPAPASREDLQRTEEKIKEEIREAERKSAEQMRADREAAKTESEVAAAKAAAAVKEAEERLARISEEQRLALEYQQRRAVKIIVAALLVISFVFFAVLYLHKGRNQKGGVFSFRKKLNTRAKCRLIRTFRL